MLIKYLKTIWQFRSNFLMDNRWDGPTRDAMISSDGWDSWESKAVSSETTETKERKWFPISPQSPPNVREKAEPGNVFDFPNLKQKPKQKSNSKFQIPNFNAMAILRTAQLIAFEFMGNGAISYSRSLQNHFLISNHSLRAPLSSLLSLQLHSLPISA